MNHNNRCKINFLNHKLKIMDVSVIIVNYRTAALAKDAIASIIEKTSGLSYEIIMVDSSPDSNSRETLGNIKPGVPYRYIELRDNPGFGAANNEGFRYADGKYIFCLNPDTLLINNAIKKLYDFMETHTRCGACGGNLYHPDMRPAHSYRRILPGILWELSEGMKRHPEHLLFGRNSKFNHTNHPKRVGYITGADLMLRAQVLKEIGTFSPDFFMYFEETDLCCRIRKAGYDVVSVPTAKIIHFEGMSTKGEDIKRGKFKYYADSRVEYYKRNVALKRAARAYKIYLKNLRKDAKKLGEIGKNAKYQYQCAIKALDRFPELKKVLISGGMQKL